MHNMNLLVNPRHNVDPVHNINPVTDPNEQAYSAKYKDNT
jgi:hypothetical protein